MLKWQVVCWISIKQMLRRFTLFLKLTIAITSNWLAEWQSKRTFNRCSVVHYTSNVSSFPIIIKLFWRGSWHSCHFLQVRIVFIVHSLLWVKWRWRYQSIGTLAEIHLTVIIILLLLTSVELKATIILLSNVGPLLVSSLMWCSCKGESRLGV